MSKNETEDEILKLIRFVDRNRSNMFRKLDVFRGDWTFPFSTLIGVLVFMEIFLLFGVASATEKLTITFSFLAFSIAYFSLMGQFGEENIVKVNFKRFEKCVEGDEKPLLKALIRIKAKDQQFDLEQIYNMNDSMFTIEKLLEKLYD